MRCSPSLTFVATAAAVIHCGATPVLVDICSLQDPTMDPVDAENKVTSRTKALLPVHYAGIPADMQAIVGLANARGLSIVEDAAHAPGAKFRRTRHAEAGATPDVSVFRKQNITTAEGGHDYHFGPGTGTADATVAFPWHDGKQLGWNRDGRLITMFWNSDSITVLTTSVRPSGWHNWQNLKSSNKRRQEIVDRYNRLFVIPLPV